MRYIMVLNDGETYTSLEGCRIVALLDDVDDETVERILPDLKSVVSFDVNEGKPIYYHADGGHWDLIYDSGFTAATVTSFQENP